MANIEEIQAIDVHGHYGDYVYPGKELEEQFMTGSLELVLKRARRANIETTVVSPLTALLPRGNTDAVKGNIEAWETVRPVEAARFWVVIDPRKEKTFEQAREFLTYEKCMGIKIHPEEHLYHIDEFAERIFKFAADNGAIVASHSGEENSVPEDYVKYANAFPEVNLIVCHLGCGWDGDRCHQVRAIQSSQHGNIYTDTSSAGSIVSGLIEWAVGQVGAEKIMFGTDTPLYFSPAQRERINKAEITNDQKRLILRDNAMNLLPL